MRDYAKMVPTFWTGKTGKALKKKGMEAVVVAAYLVSSPHSNMLGLYFQPVLYMAHETGLGIEGATKGLTDACDAGFCSFDEESEMVWVHEMASYQIASELKASDKRCAGIQKDYNALPDNPFLTAFFDKYQQAFNLTRKRTFGTTSEAPSKPLLSQEQEQEQEQEQDSSSLRSEEAAPKARLPRPKKEECTLGTYLTLCKAEGRKPLPSDHPIRAYCTDAGISDEMLQVAWIVFRDDYATGKNNAKRQKDWPAHFSNSVKRRWYQLWFTNNEGAAEWTSTGMQEKKVIETRTQQPREATHEHA